MSILPGSARELARMLAGSRLVRLGGPLPPRGPTSRADRIRVALIGYAECNDDGDDGQPLSDYDLIGSETRRSGLFALQGGPDFNFLYLPPPARDRDIGMSALVVGRALLPARNALLLVDPPVRWRGVQQALEGLADWPFHSADALMFFPRLLAPDRLTGRKEEFPPCAAAIGTLLRHAPAQVWREHEEKYEGAWVLKKDIEAKFAASRAAADEGARVQGRERKADLAGRGEPQRREARAGRQVLGDRRAEEDDRGEGPGVPRRRLAHEGGAREVRRGPAQGRRRLEADPRRRRGAPRRQEPVGPARRRTSSCAANVRYSKIVLAFKAADDAANAAVGGFGHRARRLGHRAVRST